ncbi:apoptosis inhibitory protein [Arabidopsis thaliana]|uniref:Apoptosis inhibitory protein n=1 Tax=Arabidopsis thaliana TaxID=3702 RepID=A0A1P8AN37_ARATH|nr:apoptosis inhibitory protein [Arabidopsis thaliana]ANM58063.1 apoptosis inhibitory protein [Arabidopsis thaliana]|eukprot:NP_001320527.1 apoptosis inhibitory protein [Arabidopsis thaliana]
MSNPEMNKLLNNLELKKLLGKSEVISICDIELICKHQPELISKIIDVLVEYLNTEKPVECDAVQEVFMAMVHVDKEASLTAMLNHLANFKVPDLKNKLPIFIELALYKSNLTKRRISDVLEKSLQKESEADLQRLAQYFETKAGLDTFDVSDAHYVDRFISCLLMAVPFFARGAPSSKYFEFMNRHHILHHFDKLTEHRKLDFLKSLAEMSSDTTAQAAGQMLPSIIELLKKCIPDTKMERESMNISYIECLLYVLHHLAIKAPAAATDFCNEEFMLRLDCVRSITRARLKKLDTTLAKDDKKVKSLCLLTGLIYFFYLLRDSTCPIAPIRSDALESVSKDCKLNLDDTGICDLTDKQVQSILDYSKYHQVSRNKNGACVLNDNDDIAMLGWQMKKSDLSFLETAGEQGRSGEVRDQLFHLLCWAYAGSDLVSYQRLLQKWERKTLPLCPWYLCAFCEPEKLGEEEILDRNGEKKILVDRHGRVHHCYGGTIEKALCHVQSHGIPRDVVTNFLCTDYHPPSADEPDMERRKIKGFRKINTWKDVVEALQKQQIVGADLLNYSQLMMTSGKYIYKGPMSRMSVYVGYHAVVIEQIKKMNGEWVAVCKMSNGTLVADYGYAYVSIEVQYMPVGASDLKRKRIRGSDHPMHLLTNFIIVDMVEADENDRKDAESEESEEKDSENEEEEDYIPKAKRGLTKDPKPKRSRTEDPTMVKESDAVGDTGDAISRHNSDSTTKVMELVALVKLLSGFPSISKRIKDIIVKQKGSLLLGMQQRAIEYNSIVDRHKNIRSSLVDRMPVLDEATFNVRRAGHFPASASTMAQFSVSLPNGVEKPAVDLLFDEDFFQDLLCVYLGSSLSQSGATQAPKAGTYRDMIRAVRACQTAAEERAVVRKECANIRALINEDDPHDRHRNLAKLMLIHMLGYPTHFVQMECLKLIASPGFPEKRIGYLGLMLMLVTKSLKQDLNHSNQYVVGLALFALGNICSAEMAPDLAPEVERLVQFRDPNIRKKAALCSTRIVRKVPDLVENFVNADASLLKEKHHGVLIRGVQLCYELCTINDEALEYFRTKCTEGLIKFLRDITNCAYQPEYDVAGITDPFLQRRLLRFLRVLGQGDADASDLMTHILAQVTESDAVDAIEDAIAGHNSDLTTKVMAFVALLKLSSGFPSISERIKDMIVKQKGSLHLEMQQRAIEFNSIVERHKRIRSSMGERMAELDEAVFNVRRAGSLLA